MQQPRELKEQFELRQLSRYAQKTAQTRGRRQPQPPCSVRTDYERDIGRIIYSRDFRRMRQKTQVFFNPRNDHVCTRMEHVLYVNYIASTIGKALGLNSDLIEAIALGHDIGHAPFGHSGEYELSACLEAAGANFDFHHEAHSLRVVDLLAAHHDGHGLNLTFEVRDGIVSHCGEKYGEYCLKPDRQKTEDEVQISGSTHHPPATLEGCVVRMADKIAYVGRDIEDAARAQLMDFADIPKQVRDVLGQDNGQIINTLVCDIINHSIDQDAIIMSAEVGEALEELLQANVKQIYSADRIRTYERISRQIINSLFHGLLAYADDLEKLEHAEVEVLRDFRRFLAQHPEPQAANLRKVTDYIAGMTDHYADRVFNDLYQL